MTTRQRPFDPDSDYDFDENSTLFSTGELSRVELNRLFDLLDKIVFDCFIADLIYIGGERPRYVFRFTASSLFDDYDCYVEEYNQGFDEVLRRINECSPLTMQSVD